MVILDMILLNIHRFKALDIQHRNQEILFALMNLSKYSLQNLEQLDMYWLVTSLQHPDIVFSSFENAPKLCRVSFASHVMFYDPQLLLLPWEQLTEVSIKCMEISPTTIYTTLLRCQALVMCKLIISAGAMIATGSTLDLPSLETLVILCAGFAPSTKDSFIAHAFSLLLHMGAACGCTKGPAWRVP
jgi:hypothetical protein